MRLVLAFFLLFTTSVFAKKIAILVGVGNVPSYLNTHKDIETMKLLIGNEGVIYDKIVVLEDKKAIYSNIKKELVNLYELESTDTLLFYYTGHGCRAWGGVEEKDGKDEFLMFYGVTFSPTNPTKIVSGVMLDDEFNYHFSKIKAKKILIFDACHSETSTKGYTNKSKFIKSIPHVKSQETIFTMVQKKNLTYMNAKKSNYIQLSASLDDQRADDSDKGGIFTLTLKDVLYKSKSISFSTLMKNVKTRLPVVAKNNHRAGDFTPNITVSTELSAESVQTKDIFVVQFSTPPLPKTETLESFLQSRLGGLKFEKQQSKSRFSLYEEVELKSHHSSNYSNLYIIEVKKNHYNLISTKKLSECSSDSCVFKDLIASEPLGKSNIYLIASKNPLSIAKKAFSESLKSQLKHQKFEVGMVSFETVK